MRLRGFSSFLLFISCALEARIIHVSSNAAIKSIQQVNDLHLVAGDQVLFKAGETFIGTLVFNAEDSSNAQNPILISSYGEGRAVITPDFNRDGVHVTDTSGYKISNLIIRSPHAETTGNGIKIYSGHASKITSDITLENVEVSGFGGTDTNGFAFGNGILIDNTPEGSGVNNVTLLYVHSHHNAQAGFRSLSRNEARHSNIKISYSDFYQNPGLTNHPWTNTGSGINLSAVSGAIVEYSRAYENGRLNIANGGPVGIWTWNSDHVTFRYNEAFRNRTGSATDGGGFDLDGNVSDALVEHNLSYENDGPGYLVCGIGGLGPVRRSILRNNVSINDARKNSYGAAHVYFEVYDTVFENNYFVAAKSETARPTLVNIHDWRGTGLVFKGNKFKVSAGVPTLSMRSQNVPEGLEIQDDGTYEGLESENELLTMSNADGMCVDIWAGNTQDGGNLQSYNCHGRWNQRWLPLKKENNEVVIATAHGGKCLDVWGGSVDEGAEVKLFQCKEGPNQRFIPLEENETGFRSYKHLRSGKCLSLGSATEHLKIESCNGSREQLFRFSSE